MKDVFEENIKGGGKAPYNVRHEEKRHGNLVLIPNKPQIFLHAIQSRIPDINPIVADQSANHRQQACEQSTEVVRPIQEAEQVKQHDQRDDVDIQLAHQPLLCLVIDLGDAALDRRRRLVREGVDLLSHCRHTGPQPAPGRYVVAPRRESGLLLHVRVQFRL